MDNMSNYDVCYSIYFFQNVYTNLRKNRNLECWVIFGHLWVKNGGEKAYQPPAAQNPGNAPAYALCSAMDSRVPQDSHSGADTPFCWV